MQTCYHQVLSPAYLAVLDVSPCLIKGLEGMLINRINVPRHTGPDGKPLFRGQGIASDLLKRCLKDADAEQVTLLIEVSPSDGLTYDELVAWYKRYGFKKTWWS